MTTPAMTITDYLAAAYAVANGLQEGNLSALATQMAGAGFTQDELTAERARHAGGAVRCFVAASAVAFLDQVIGQLA